MNIVSLTAAPPLGYRRDDSPGQSKPGKIIWQKKETRCSSVETMAKQRNPFVYVEGPTAQE